MTSATTKSVYWEGVRAGAPFVIVVVPFSLLFGVAATDAGLTLGQAMGFSVLVIAGASQFAALQMMVDQAGIALVLLAALAVNLRMAMYSAALVPALGQAPLWQRACVAYLLFDQTYLASVKAYEERPAMGVRARIAYFFGVATPITPIWCGMTAVGVLVGATIPPAMALDFALPITFLAMVAPMLRTLAHVAAAFTSVVVALALSGLPSGFGLLIAAACAMVVGVLVEDRT
ncbi:Predicted branched-chain amino acid permease (azaleucine resistance) [Loktanella atrilutea]|uniref:Predicted branched-chain amino acid permease (Azaleucine resistance) n=1 Tax=Loktanella atrilutea TaxID=366533 RepID=A0A1M5BU70_LOKAT|nr:AzlC family ABC transporter permease [Loktanella atrilutea]SHF45772.1 Predicted branched-chain amino acid permease (azaleucine resistance) [Loktanella atrilutea]